MSFLRPITIRSSPVSYIDGLGPVSAQRLNEAGIHTVGSFRRRTEGRETSSLSEQTGLSPRLLHKWADWVEHNWYTKLEDRGPLAIPLGFVSLLARLLQVAEWPAIARTLRAIARGDDITEPSFRFPMRPFHFAAVFYPLAFVIFSLVPNELSTAHPDFRNLWIYLYHSWLTLLTVSLGIHTAARLFRVRISYTLVFKVVLFGIAPLTVLMTARPTIQQYTPAGIRIFINVLGFGVGCYFFYIFLRLVHRLVRCRRFRLLVFYAVATSIWICAELGGAAIMELAIYVRDVVTHRDVYVDQERSFIVHVPDGWQVASRREVLDGSNPYGNSVLRDTIGSLMGIGTSAVAVLWTQSPGCSAVMILHKYDLMLSEQDFEKQTIRSNALQWFGSEVSWSELVRPSRVTQFFEQRGVIRTVLEDQRSLVVAVDCRYRTSGGSWYGLVCFLIGDETSDWGSQVRQDLDAMTMSLRPYE